MILKLSSVDEKLWAKKIASFFHFKFIATNIFHSPYIQLKLTLDMSAIDISTQFAKNGKKYYIVGDLWRVKISNPKN